MSHNTYLPQYQHDLLGYRYYNLTIRPIRIPATFQ